jgi:hypothetical protein
MGEPKALQQSVSFLFHTGQGKGFVERALPLLTCLTHHVVVVACAARAPIKRGIFNVGRPRSLLR